MNNRYQEVCEQLARKPARWLVTGAAGFIGSNLLQKLLSLDQEVVGLDNLSTGFTKNLDQVRGLVTPAQWARFRFVNGDIQNLETCREACRSADYLLHQAALGSVPRSIEDPVTSNASNVDGFVSICWAAHLEKVKSAVYASSSAVYGDHPALPKREEAIGESLSPYGATKLMNEIYAGVFSRCYGMKLTGLRYFNVFGPRQDPDGAYAAVIPKWIASMIRNQPIQINGDGETSRDFCYIANVVQANILAATDPGLPTGHRVFNVALDQRLTLNQLFQLLRERLMNDHPHLKKVAPLYAEFRAGDVRHSQADISLIRKVLGYEPTYNVSAGLDEALSWYQANLKG
ncbi:MAG: SDR family oxidoreductase [Verrucomicrobiales bacterium]|nr:SDR family oxidoreductase [Verrucomicrobiales bacterium]